MYVVDRIRIESFRQLKREIRGSADHLIVGIDVGKENHHSFFGTSSGKTLWIQSGSIRCRGPWRGNPWK